MLDTKVESIDDKSVSFANADGSDSVDGDLVLVATGRTPNTKGLGLEELGLDIDPRGGVRVDDRGATKRSRPLGRR